MAIGNESSIGKGSSVSLFYAEEHQYGKPDWNYSGTTKTVSVRVDLGDVEDGTAPAPDYFIIEVEGTNFTTTEISSAKITAGLYVAVYTGDYQGVVQVFKVAAREGTTGVRINAERTRTNYVIKKGDTIELLDDSDPFNVGRIRAIDGLVSANLAVEIGSIEDESLGVSGGSRARGAARRGSISGDGGNFVVQPDIKSFGRLLKHAIGCNVYYNSLKGDPVSSGANTTIDNAGGYDAGATAIDVDSSSGFTAGDIVRIGPNSDGYYDYVVLTAASGDTLTFTGTALNFNHAHTEDVYEVTGSQINLAAGYDRGDTEIIVDSASNFDAGDRIRIGRGDTAELVTITGKSGNTLTFADQLLYYDHADNEIVIKVEAGVIPHEIRKSDLPTSMTIYQYHSDLEALYVVPGGRVGSFDLTGTNEDATLKSTFNTVVKSSQLLKELPFTQPKGSHTPYTSIDMFLREGGLTAAPLVGLNSATVNGDNEVTPLKSMDGTGTYSSAAEGTGRWTVEFNYQLLDVDRFQDTVEGKTESWVLEMAYGDRGANGESITFEFPESTLTGNVVANAEEDGPLSPDATLLTGLHPDKSTNVICVVNSDEGQI